MEGVIVLPTGRHKIAETPEVLRRRLTAVLRRQRHDAGLTAAQVAEALDWSASKVIRIETSVVGVSTTDLRALLELYNITNEKQRDELLELARRSKKQSWSDYSDVYNAQARAFFGFEEAADAIYAYEPTVIPDLLQTEDYARNLLQGLGYDQAVERMVQGQLVRQDILDQTPEPRLRFILGEAAVRCMVGGFKVMSDQWERLKILSQRPGISLQVLPFKVGAHPRMRVAFTILEFADETLDDIIYAGDLGREWASRENAFLAHYREDFLTLERLAMPIKEFALEIDKLASSG